MTGSYVIMGTLLANAFGLGSGRWACARRTDVIHDLTRTLIPGQGLLSDWALMRQKAPVDALFRTLYFLVFHL